MDYLRAEISKGTVTDTDIINFCTNRGITSDSEQKKALKLYHDYIDNKGEWALPYKDIEAYIPEIDKAKGTEKAKLQRTVRELSREKYKDMLAKNGGNLPGDIQNYVPEIAKAVQESFTQEYRPGGNYTPENEHWYIPDVLERRPIAISKADLRAAGFIAITRLGDRDEYSDDDKYMLLRTDGTREYLTGAEVMNLVGGSGYAE